MVKKTSSKTELPEYLGLGTLDKKTIKSQGKNFSADYLYGNDLVFRVSRVRGTVLIEEYLDGHQLGVTMHDNLQKAFLQHMMSFIPYQNRRFERLFHEICDGRNIILRFPHQSEPIYYPAGYIFALRLPIIIDNKNAWEQLALDLKNRGEQMPMKIIGQHSAILLQLLKSGELREENLTVVDCSAMLIQLLSAARLFWENKTLLSEKEYRLSITGLSESVPGNLSIYLGEPDRGFLTYSIVTTDELDVPIQEVKNEFQKRSKELLSSL